MIAIKTIVVLGIMIGMIVIANELLCMLTRRLK